MKITFYPVIVCALLITDSAIAQKKLPNNAFEAYAGYSHHGSGDMHGVVFSGGYVSYLTKRFSLTYNMLGTINSSKHEIIVYNNTTQTKTDASVRFTTGGVQLGVNAGLSCIRTRQHEMMFSLGAFGRYQSASNGSDGYGSYSPAVTGQPTVLISYDNKTPQETIAFGGIFQVQYNYTFRNNVYLGIRAAVQTDTNGDAIPHAGLSIGKRI